MSKAIVHHVLTEPGQVPSVNDIEIGELAINIVDQIAYSRNEEGIFAFGSTDKPKPPPTGSYDAGFGFDLVQGQLGNLDLSQAADKSSKFSFRFFIDLKAYEAPSPPPAPQPPSGDFPVMHNFMSRGRPSNAEIESRYGIIGAKCHYESSIYGGSKPPKGSEKFPSESKVKDLARSTKSHISCLDIEHAWEGFWRSSSDSEKSRLARDYPTILKWYKDALSPGQVMGHYSAGIWRDYWNAIQGPDSSAYKNWQRINDIGAPVFTASDACFPSLYTFYKDKRNEWVRYANANCAEAKRVSGGLPVYGYLWPQYHNSGDAKFLYIDGAFWRLQLETLYADPNCQGCVIWGLYDPNVPPGGPRDYTHWHNAIKQDWFKETVDFINTVNSGKARSFGTQAVEDELIFASDSTYHFSCKLSAGRTHMRFAIDPGIMHMDSVPLEQVPEGAGEYWVEVMGSVDLEAQKASLYMNKKNVLADVQWKSGTEIDFDKATNFTIGGQPGNHHSMSLQGAVQELYLTDALVDWPVVWNNFSANGHPAFLGHYGEHGTGEAPMVYLAGEPDVSTVINRGYAGGNFNKLGTVGIWPTRPFYLMELPHNDGDKP